MKTLSEVEAAKQLMTEAMRWSVMKWLGQKKHVRHAADRANAALDRLSDEIRQQWPENLRVAYQALSASNPREKSNGSIRHPEIASESRSAVLLAQRLKDADDQVYRARMAAEQTFDEAEKKLSTMLAKEGCLKAIESWQLHEQAIRLAEKCVRITR